MMRMMKMAAVSTITVLLLCCSIFAAKGSQPSCDHFAAVNDNFTVPLHNAPQNVEQLRWKHGDLLIFYRRSNKVLKGNEKDVLSNGSLKLTNLDKSKAGTYTPEVYNEAGKLIADLKSITLCVLDRVPTPQVTFRCSQSSVKFTCNAGQSRDLKLEWLQDDKVLEKEKSRTLERKFEDMKTRTFNCKVSNSVSFIISPPIKHNCTEPGFVFPTEIFGINTWIFVGGGGGVVVLLIITVIICCVHNRRKKSMHVKDEEELRLGWTNPNQQHPPQQHSHPPGQHHHHHHHHHQQQPAGHTGPRQHRSKQPRSQQRPRAPNQPNGQPQPSPRRLVQGSRPTDTTDDEKPPPLPQPRKKAPKTSRV